MKLGFIAAIIIFSGATSFGSETSLSSKAKAVCKHETGYGTFTGSGDNAHLARAEASKSCFHRLVDQYEESYGHLPSPDQADDMIDACINICP